MVDTRSEGAGGVIWITGFSAAGKTTVGRATEARLKTLGCATILLDGDDLRSILSQRWGYDRDERIDLARVYFRLCSHLASQGYVVIICAIAMYKEVREWVSENIPRAVEVYLKVPQDVRRERDASTKGLYAKIGDTSQLYDEPDVVNLVINNFGINKPEEAAIAICNYYLSANFGGADRGRTAHWESFYSQEKGVFQPSPFAEAVEAMLPSASRLLEIGCGNGRDAAYFASKNHEVVAIDLSDAAIELCREQHSTLNIDFRSGPLSCCEEDISERFDHIYSRFVIHAMPVEEEEATLASAHRLLHEGGMLHIECRSINDPMARLGEVLSPTERINGHYRRFIILDEFCHRLTHAGFDVVEAIESNGLAVFGDEDPVVLRVTAVRK